MEWGLSWYKDIFIWPKNCPRKIRDFSYVCWFAKMYSNVCNAIGGLDLPADNITIIIIITHIFLWRLYSEVKCLLYTVHIFSSKEKCVKLNFPEKLNVFFVSFFCKCFLKEKSANFWSEFWIFVVVKRIEIFRDHTVYWIYLTFSSYFIHYYSYILEI